MKTKIAQIVSATALLLTLHFGTDIGGPTIPPKPNSGPAHHQTNLDRAAFNCSEAL